MNSGASLYDVLQISRDATPDEIRKAYKKQALLTHPDRLPAGFTPSEKQNAEERFRQVSNAYEVLKDPENRRLYDTHGVWPPPTPAQETPYPHRAPPHRSAPRHNSYEPFRDPFANFFTEPFDLFDKMFSDYRRPSYHPVHRSASNWRDPFEAMYRIQDIMADLERDMFTAFPTRSLSLGFDSPQPFGDRGQIRWAQESTMLTTRNGVTHRIHKRRDWDGNEHVTRTYPDGREIYTINGVEQQRPSRGYLPPPAPPARDPWNMLPPPPQMNNSRNYVSPPPSYHSARSSAHPSHHSSYSGFNDRTATGHRRDSLRHHEPVVPVDSGESLNKAASTRLIALFRPGHP
ncbi:hypothetical protein B0H15DRAFT_267084 [Mycena belliarum]|uniref:J domain-containing protein n=1 Tax=Mycena belliarum TaxID=1033014 RepID=A0AAD6U9C2_9AGAR|nr:hypothetical protein B0H15DRAFT_267084 [Mycena belliae]